MLDDILLQVNKPGRYIGQEWNLPKKKFDEAYIKFALCFPDLYEIGMSNLGIRIIYGILNNIPDVTCERFFSVDSDLEVILRNNNLEIFSLETRRKLKEFDLIGFSLGHELNYTNVLNILDLGAIPLLSSLRNHAYPLVIGGGPCVLNPEPMHEFFDLFVLGEVEEAILEIINLYRRYKDKFKAGRISKQDLLVNFSSVEGVYIPSLYEVRYNSQQKIEEFKPKILGMPTKIRKRFVRNLDSASFPLNWLVPYIEIVHDRITLEIMRGCANSCRFCQSRSQYFPLRERSLQNIVNLVQDIYKQTGYEDISLSGLSVSDYSDIEVLLRNLISSFKEKAVSISLPSIKPKTIIGNLVSLLSTIKKTGLTFAPEAGAQRLRDILGKKFDIQDFFKAIEEAYACGYQHIKLYFMIGLPFEGYEDLDAIIELSSYVSDLRRKINKSPAQVNISINTLIPKPHTPFQWLRMLDLESIKLKQSYLRSKLRNRRMRLNFHNRYMSVLEAILSRGDRRLSEVISSAFKRGARFDAWLNHFDFARWQAAFKETNVNSDFYLQEKTISEVLPWDFLDIGLSKESLISEFKKSIEIQ